MGNLVMILTDMFSNDLPSFPSLARRGLRGGLNLSSLLAGLFADAYRRGGDETCRAFDGLIMLPTEGWSCKFNNMIQRSLRKTVICRKTLVQTCLAPDGKGTLRLLLKGLSRDRKNHLFYTCSFLTPTNRSGYRLIGEEP